MPAPSVHSAARDAASNPVLRMLARGGYAANGIVHVLIGAITLAIAVGARAEGDQMGALKAVAGAPLGFVLVWLIAIALCALGVWHAVAGVIVPRFTHDVEGAARKWGRRISEWGQAAIFIALGLIAAAVALGARPSSEEAVTAASRGVLQLPGGSIVLGLTGLGVGIGGVSFIVMGVARSFRNRMDIPDDTAGSAITTLGVVGFVAKGISLAIVGVLLIVAAVQGDAAVAGALDGAIDALLELVLGPLLAGVVGVGFIAYGVFTVFRAKYATL
ncbi:DUF1206 domain-containing protein [Planococcus sp. APC 4015]|nr:DUF1206 domain-containing protein [Planococcus sp. APC 4015]